MISSVQKPEESCVETTTSRIKWTLRDLKHQTNEQKRASLLGQRQRLIGRESGAKLDVFSKTTWYLSLLHDIMQQPRSLRSLALFMVQNFSGTYMKSVSQFRHYPLSSMLLYDHTETIRTIRDGKPRTATSTFTQLLVQFSSVLLYVHRDRKDY